MSCIASSRISSSCLGGAIHIPIIGDKAAEGPESFYVNLAWGEDEGPAERVEVVIVDDD